MNVFTVQKATIAFGMFLLEKFADAKTRGVVISHDNRHLSRQFTLESARLLNEMGIKAFIFDSLRPTPELSYAVRDPITYCGINIIGLRRRGFSNETIENIHNTYRIIYQSGLNISDALQKVEAEVEMTPEIQYIVDFVRSSERGIIK
jgi:hypothetical protein